MQEKKKKKLRFQFLFSSSSDLASRATEKETQTGALLVSVVLDFYP